MNAKRFTNLFVSLLFATALVAGLGVLMTPVNVASAHSAAPALVAAPQAISSTLPVTLTGSQIDFSADGIAKFLNSIFAMFNNQDAINADQANVNADQVAIDTDQDVKIGDLDARLSALEAKPAAPAAPALPPTGGLFDPSTLWTVDGLRLGVDYTPTQGITLTWTGTGRVCRYASVVTAVIPMPTSLDMNGWKYLAGDFIPAGVGTYHDCDRWAEIVAAGSITNTASATLPPAPAPAPKTVGSSADFCDATALSGLPLVSSVDVVDAGNAQYQLHFNATGVFTVPMGSDLIFYGQKYGRTGVGPVVAVEAGQEGTLWGAECMKVKPN